MEKQNKAKTNKNNNCRKQEKAIVKEIEIKHENTQHIHTLTQKYTRTRKGEIAERKTLKHASY